MIVEKTVPEPSVLMFGLTAAGMLIARRRRRTLHA
jgi:MYXO-CTERM domain-containing protein